MTKRKVDTVTSLQYTIMYYTNAIQVVQNLLISSGVGEENMLACE